MKPEYKVIFHIDRYDVEPLNIALKNADNLIKDKGASLTQIAIVVNYLAPKLFLQKTINENIHRQIVRLTENKNMAIYICNNSLKNLEINREELLPSCEVVPAGITKIIELQNNGFAYVKP